MAKERINDADNRQILGKLFQLVHLNRLAAFARDFERGVRLFFYYFSEFRFERFLILLKYVLHRLRRCQAHQHAKTCFFPYEFDRLNIVGVKHRNLKILARTLERNNIIFARDRFRNNPQHLGINRLFGKINKWDAKNIGLETLEICLFYVPLGNQNIAEGFLSGFRFFLSFFQVRGLYEP